MSHHISKVTVHLIIKDVPVRTDSHPEDITAARHYLTRTKWSQTAIAKKLRVTVPCVNQVATELAAR